MVLLQKYGLESGVAHFKQSFLFSYVTVLFLSCQYVYVLDSFILFLWWTLKV